LPEAKLEIFMGTHSPQFRSSEQITSGRSFLCLCVGSSFAVLIRTNSLNFFFLENSSNVSCFQKSANQTTPFQPL